MHPGEPSQPVANVRRHSTGNAFSWPRVLLIRIQAAFSVVAPCPEMQLSHAPTGPIHLCVGFARIAQISMPPSRARSGSVPPLAHRAACPDGWNRAGLGFFGRLRFRVYRVRRADERTRAFPRHGWGLVLAEAVNRIRVVVHVAEAVAISIDEPDRCLKQA